VTYTELRALNARAYCRQNAALFGLVPTWGPLWNCAGQLSGGDPQSLFNQIHDAGIQAIATQSAVSGQVDWTQTYAAIKPLLEAQPLTPMPVDVSQKTAIDPATLLATIITAVLGVVCPPTAAFSAILEPIIAAIVKVLFSSLTTQFTGGTYGASPDAFNAQLQQWAQEAAGS
jgi:hypothetical protein